MLPFSCHFELSFFFLTVKTADQWNMCPSEWLLSLYWFFFFETEAGFEDPLVPFQLHDSVIPFQHSFSPGSSLMVLKKDKDFLSSHV